MKVPGITMKEATAALGRLGRHLREGSDSVAVIVAERQAAERFVLQGEALGFSRAQVWGITDAVIHGHPEADVGQVRELALRLMMSGAICAKKEDK